MRKRVVLPAPFGPTRPTFSPGLSWKDASTKRTCRPYCLLMRENEIMPGAKRTTGALQSRSPSILLRQERRCMSIRRISCVAAHPVRRVARQRGSCPGRPRQRRHRRHARQQQQLHAGDVGDRTVRRLHVVRLEPRPGRHQRRAGRVPAGSGHGWRRDLRRGGRRLDGPRQPARRRPGQRRQQSLPRSRRMGTTWCSPRSRPTCSPPGSRRCPCRWYCAGIA